jgi:hypothetical protein
MDFKANAEDVKKTFFEKDPAFFFLISFFILYLDVAVFVITGANLLDFKFSEIGNSIPIGKVLLAIPPYFLILYIAPKLRSFLQRKIPPLGYPGLREQIRTMIDDSDVVSLHKAEDYALATRDQVLYHYIHSRRESLDNIDTKASIRFAFWIMTIWEVSQPGLVLHELLSRVANDSTILWIIFVPGSFWWVVVLVFCVVQFILTIRPFDRFEMLTSLPKHPLTGLLQFKKLRCWC